MNLHRHVVATAVGFAALAGSVGCSPTPMPDGNITCAGTSGTVVVTPGVTWDPQPMTYTLAGPAGRTACQDGTGTGITDAGIEDLTLHFESIACAVTSGTAAWGNGTVAWSDGTRSRFSATATLDGALDGELAFAITSGHFVGRRGATRFVAVPSRGSCSASEPITEETVTIGAVTLRSR